ncbi:MAG: FAD:protein FMN transferase [Gemmatimonadota bacterium]
MACEVRLALAAMGTRFELVIQGRYEPVLRAAGEAALEAIETAHRELTRFEPSSLLSHIRRAGRDRPVPLTVPMVALFADAQAVWRASDGAFDPTTADGAGFEAVELDFAAGTVRLRKDVALDFGAIGKGHALELAAAVLREHGVTSAFLHGGTSSAVAIGAPPGEQGWRVGLEGDDAPVLTLADAALSVSGARGRQIPDGDDWVSHVTDPRSGDPLTGDGRVAVIGPCARLADAWSTAALVLGRRPAALGPEWDVLLGAGGRWTRDAPSLSFYGGSS